MAVYCQFALTWWRTASPAQILSQLNDGAAVPLKILTQAKAKEPSSNAIPELLEQLSSSVRTSLIRFFTTPHVNLLLPLETCWYFSEREAYWPTRKRMDD